MVQWLRICLPKQGTQVQFLVQVDLTCHRAAKPTHTNYWSPHTLEPMLCNRRSHHHEKPVNCNQRVAPTHHLHAAQLSRAKPHKSDSPALLCRGGGDRAPCQALGVGRSGAKARAQGTVGMLTRLDFALLLLLESGACLRRPSLVSEVCVVSEAVGLIQRAGWLLRGSSMTPL